ncbi:General stress protein 69 [Polystyrenella longa]|uniref:General stress protein 69 n=1 Tax=Polystyrenella longa TaxID=2528007 RepID=A0A518CR08_9PLAN|nr:aldo/keto reductase [Polystyrenella longa]QDU81657.1 General stress protein 69 [Polystyrenella longa]
MKLKSLGQTDLQVSEIGMGCVTFGREIDQASSFEILDYALEKGINLLDTAAAYAAGASEQVVGGWMKDRGCRDQVVLATKVNGELTRDYVLRSAEESLERLQTDCIDLYQLHSWDNTTPLEETLGALEELVQAGKVRFIGCSNFQAWQLAKGLLWSASTGGPRIESIQPPYNLVQREIESDVLPLCQDQKVGVLSYSPLGAGFLTGKYSRDGEVPTGSRFDVIPGHQPIYFSERGYSVIDDLRKLAEETGIPMLQLALRWVIQNEGVTSMLVGARERRHLDQAFAARELNLTADSKSRLDEIGQE